MKLLHSFKLKKPSDNKEIELAIRKPTRSECDEADMMYSAFQSDCIRRGILTKEMTLKAYKNFGGAMSDTESKEYQKLTSNFYAISKKLETAKNEKQKQAFQKEYDMIWLALSQINNEHERLFDRTADVIARNKTILYLVLLLTIEKENGGWKNVFVGTDHSEREESFALLEEENFDDAEAILRKASTFVTFWYYGDRDIKEEDFKEYERVMYPEEVVEKEKEKETATENAGVQNISTE
jgi:hypothetical protein